MSPEEVSESQNRVLPLVADSGNRKLLVKWLDNNPDYETVELAESIDETDFDVCILDTAAFERHLDGLRAKKTATAPVLIPYLLLLPESGVDSIDTDAGQLADTVVTQAVDELVTLPIQQAELHWRLSALLRLREQSLALRERERELERQLDLFEKAQDIANVGAWEYDTQSEDAFWSEEVYRIHALPDDTKPSPEKSLQQYHPDDRPIIEDAFEAAVEKGEPYDIEVRLIDAEGNRRWVRTRGEPQYEDGEVTRVRGTIQDITERKGRERDLQRIKQAVEATSHAIYITDTDGTIEYVNPAFEEMTGFTEREVVGETPRVLDSGEMSDDYFADLWETLLSGEVWKEEITNRRKNGETYTAMQTVAPVTDGEDIHAFVAVQDDITERKQREVELQQRSQAMDEAPIGITITDPSQADNPLVYVNERFIELTGYARAEAVGRNCRFLQGEQTDPETVATIRRAVDAAEPVSVVMRNYRADGTEFWNQLEIAPVRDSDGEVMNFIGFQQDVTERVQRQRQLQKIDQVLRHNLKNDLNVVQGMADQLKRAVDPADQEYADRILRTTDGLLATMDKERAITQLLSEKPEIGEVALLSAVESLVEQLQAEYPGAEIAVTGPDSLSVAGTTELSAAIEELIRNGIKHTDRETPRVEVVVEDVSETVTVTVSDNGPGIPEMELEILTGEAKETPLYHGQGLGLWLVQLIVQRSNGTITFKTTESHGSTVTVKLQKWRS